MIISMISHLNRTVETVGRSAGRPVSLKTPLECAISQSVGGYPNRKSELNRASVAARSSG